MLRRLIIGSGVLVLVVGAWVWFGPLSSWRSIERVPFDPASARQALVEAQPDPLTAVPTTGPTGVSVLAGEHTSPSAVSDEGEAETPTPTTTATTAPVEIPDSPEADPDLDVYLILGSDEKRNGQDLRADAILLFIAPEDRSSSILVSFPRLLYVNNPCTNELAPINVNLEGCGSVSGLDQMGVAVEDYTGLTVDHLVLFDFDGFRAIVDRIGGLEVCVDNPVKLRPDQRVFLEPGCTMLDGRRSLLWVRSRQTVEQVDGEWRLLEPAGDAGRTERQRELVRQVMRNADEFESPAALNGLLSELKDSFALDRGFSLGAALDSAQDLRRLSRRRAHDVAIAATGTVSPEGQLVLIPDRPFSEYLEVLTAP